MNYIFRYMYSETMWLETKLHFRNLTELQPPVHSSGSEQSEKRKERKTGEKNAVKIV